MNAAALESLIYDQIVGALADGTANDDTVRQIIVGINARCDLLLFWLNNGWESYGELSDDAAFAGVALTEWVAQLDALEASPPPAAADVSTAVPARDRGRRAVPHAALPGLSTAIDAKLVALRADLEQALRNVAVREPLCSRPPERLLALCSFGLNPSGYADLVAFCHPHGTALLPMRERRGRETSSVYADGALVPEGITMFYPEGDIPDEEGERTIRTFAFADMAYTSFSGRRDRSVVRMRDDLFDIEFSAGHTHDEWGGPSSEQVEAAIAAHIHTHPALSFHADRYPDPEDAEALARWLELYRSANATEGTRVVADIAERYGIDCVPAFLAAQPSDAQDRARTLGEYGEQLMRAGRPADALEVFGALEGRTRRVMTRYEARCLLTVGKFDACLALIESTLDGEPDQVHYEPSVLPFRAMALAGAGDIDAALASMRAVVDAKETGREHGPCWYAIAYALRARDPDAAEDAAYRALRHGSLYVIQAPNEDFADCDRARAAFAQRADLDAQRQTQCGQVEAVARRLPAQTPDPPVTDAGEAWVLVGHTPLEGRPKQLILGAGGRGYVPCQDDGLAVVDLSDPRAPRVERVVASATSYEGGVIAGDFLYVSDWSHGIRTFDVADPSAPVDLGCARRVHDHSGSQLAVDGDVLALATSSGVELFDIRERARPRLVSNVSVGYQRTPSLGAANDVALAHGMLFIAAGKGGLVVADVRDLAAPVVIAAICHADMSTDRICLDEDGARAFLTDGSTTWLVDVTDPAGPVSVAVVGGDFDGARVLPDGERYLLVRDDARIGYLERDGQGRWVSQRFAPRVAHSPSVADEADEAPEADDVDEAPEVDGAEDARRVGDHLVTVSHGVLAVFEREVLPAAAQPAALADDLVALERAVVGWMDGHDAQDESPIGSVKLSYYTGTVICQWDVPTRYVALATPVTWQFARIELAELLPDQAERVARLEVALVGDAARDAMTRCVRAVSETEGFGTIASGRVHLLVEIDNRPQVVDTLAFADRPWAPPQSAPIERKPPTMEDLLRSNQWYEKAPEILDRARKSARDRVALFELGKQGLWSALRTMSPLADAYEDEVVAVFIAATSSADAGDRAVSYLARYVARDDARARLGQIFETGTDGAKVIAAAALARHDDPSVFEICRGWLADGDEDEEEALDLALGTIRARIGELEAALVAWIERHDGSDHMVAAIAPHLFRAGHPTPPASLVKAALREIRQSEQYHGSDPLFGDDWEQDSGAAAYRLWTGQAVAKHVIACRDGTGGGATPSLWPAGQALEPHPASWQYLLDAAWPHLEAADAVSWFVDALCERARAGDDYAGDRAMLLAVSRRLLLGLHFAAAHRVAAAITEADEAVFDESARNKARRRYRTARLAMAFEVLKERKLAAARELSDIMLADQPDDGQVLFYDARLVWLETSVEACMEIIPGYLARVAAGDSAGRGRLLNLHGCAFDELGRHAEALPMFEKAVQTEPREMSYLANIAEIHAKLGNTEQAVAYAKRATAGGHTSEVTAGILAAAATP